jgi:hypothetical protein
LHGPQGISGHGVTAGYFERSRRRGGNARHYAGLRGIYGGEDEIRLFMLGTDSWEKGEQQDANGVGYFNDYTRSSRRRSAAACRTVAELVLVDQHGEYRHRLDLASTAARATKNTRLGENRFLRALYYFNLVRTYGAVQLNLSRPRASRFRPIARRWIRLLGGDHSDLEFAIANLPLKGAQTDYFRATKGARKRCSPRCT